MAEMSLSGRSTLTKGPVGLEDDRLLKRCISASPSKELCRMRPLVLRVDTSTDSENVRFKRPLSKSKLVNSDSEGGEVSGVNSFTVVFDDDMDARPIVSNIADSWRSR